jgi:serine/threonine protein kinase
MPHCQALPRNSPFPANSKLHYTASSGARSRSGQFCPVRNHQELAIFSRGPRLMTKFFPFTTSDSIATIGTANPMLARAKDTIIPATKEVLRYAKGQFLACGASGILEISPYGDVMKSPWPGQSGEDSRRDITIENEIYEKLGPHPRLIRIVSWDPENCVLNMEYLPNGNLQTFLTENDAVAETQRLRWVQEAAEGVQLLHDASVLHCDINPKNFLLDAHLGLKIADFGGSSLNCSKPSACSGKRFSVPDRCWRDPPTVEDDLFALGTTIYFIMACQLPFPGLSEEEVEECYRNHNFPDTSKIVCGQLIKRCWSSEIASAREIYESMQSIAQHEL